jgi:hypothetical protein
MENGFDRQGFVEYMNNAFDGFDQPFVRNLVDNVIEYGLKHERVSKDQFCYWLSDMIPEVEFGEVAMFIDDASLTKYGLEEKKKALETKIA